MEKYNGSNVLWSNRRHQDITLEEYVRNLEVLRIVYGDGRVAMKVARADGRVNARVIEVRNYGRRR